MKGRQKEWQSFLPREISYSYLIEKGLAPTARVGIRDNVLIKPSGLLFEITRHNFPSQFFGYALNAEFVRIFSTNLLFIQLSGENRSDWDHKD
jgi:hypothetical protein